MCDFKENLVMVYERVQMVFHDDGLRDHFDWDSNVLRAGEGRHEVVVFDVCCHPVGVVRYD